MKRKYEFTGETLNISGLNITVHRIRRLSDGKVGGFIEDERNLSHEGDCWVDDNAKVYDDAVISGDAQVYGDAQVCNMALIYGNAKVYGRALVSGDISNHARVYDNAEVYDNAQILGPARIYGDAKVFGDTEVNGYNTIHGNARVSGKTVLEDYAEVFDGAVIRGNNTIICEYARIENENISTGGRYGGKVDAELWDANDFYVDTDYIEDGVFPVDKDKVTDGYSYDVDWAFYISERGQEKLRSLMKNKYTLMNGICGDTCAEYLKEILKPMEVGGCCATFNIWEDGRIELCKTGFDVSLTESDRGSMFCAMPDFIMEALKRALVRCADGLKNLNRIIKDMVDEYRTDIEQLEPLPSIESDSVWDPEEEPVDMMSFIGQAISPSRYRGLTDRSRYELLDDRFAYIVDGVLICTDNECDIDCDGNICMVWPDGKVLHIGQIWMPESPEINKVKFSRSGNTLKQSCKVWYDNDHHHGGIEEEEIDLTPTPERRKCVEMNYLAADFVETFRGVDRNSFYVEAVKAHFQKKGGKEYLILESKWVKKVPQSFNRHNYWEEVHINLTDGQFEDGNGEEITGGRFFKKLRCKLEEDSGKDARVVFCERFIPTLQKLYPNVKAPLQEGLHPLYMRAMVIKDFLELTATDMVPSKSNELSNYFRDYVWINHYEVRYIMQYTKVAFDFTDDRIAEIYKHIK